MLKSQAQFKSLEEQSSIDVLNIDLKEIIFNNKRRRFNYHKNLGSEQQINGNGKYRIILKIGQKSPKPI